MSKQMNKQAVTNREHPAWVFTFGYGMVMQGCCVRIPGEYGEARDKLMDIVGCRFSFQYPASEWDAMDFPGKEREVTLNEVRMAFKAARKEAKQDGRM